MELSKSFKKEEVFQFNAEVQKLIELLNGTTIISKDPGRIKIIDKQLSKLENLVIKFEPTIYDEYSMKTKYAYNNMLKQRKEYDRVVAEKCYSDVIEEYRNKYDESVSEYKRLKEYRDRLKEVLSD